MKPFIQHASGACREFLLPIMCGYVGHLPAHLPMAFFANDESLSEGTHRRGNSEPRTISTSATVQPHIDVDILLLARLHRRRCGTRFTRRGIDGDGFTAIMVQTELIVLRRQPSDSPRSNSNGQESPCILASYVMTRGSVPWFWQHHLPSHMPRRAPIRVQPLLSSEDSRLEAVRMHFEKLWHRYGAPISCINLLDCAGYEKELQNAYSSIIQMISNEEWSTAIQYQQFNFKDKTNRMNVMRQIDMYIREQFRMHHYFCVVGDAVSPPLTPKASMSPLLLPRSQKLSSPTVATSPTSQQPFRVLDSQEGCLRVNCLDCLDRTNMIQYLAGLQAVVSLLSRIGIDVGETNTADQTYESFVKNVLGTRGLQAFRMLWLEHGDAISRLCKFLECKII